MVVLAGDDQDSGRKTGRGPETRGCPQNSLTPHWDSHGSCARRKRPSLTQRREPYSSSAPRAGAGFQGHLPLQVGRGLLHCPLLRHWAREEPCSR